MSFYKKYILLNLNEYDSFEGFNFYINIFLWILAATLCIGIFISNRRKNNMIRIVKQVFRHGARSEEKAMTFAELGVVLSDREATRLVGDGTRLSKILKRVGAKEITYEEYIASIKKKKRPKNEKKSDSDQPSEIKNTTCSSVSDTVTVSINTETSLINENAPLNAECDISSTSDECAVSEVTKDTKAEVSTAASKEVTVGEAAATPSSKKMLSRSARAKIAANAEKKTLKEQKRKETDLFAIDFKTARFFIPHEKEEEAKHILNKRISSLWQNILACVFCISLGVCLTLIMPELLHLIDNAAGF